MGILDNIMLALAGLRASKMRALLTMLGIIIGVGSVIAIVTVGNSLTLSLEDTMVEMGINESKMKNLIDVILNLYTKQFIGLNFRQSVRKSVHSVETHLISWRDIAAYECSCLVDEVVRDARPYINHERRFATF